MEIDEVDIMDAVAVLTHSEASSRVGRDTPTPPPSWKIQLTNIAAKISDMGHKVLDQLDGKIVLFKIDSQAGSAISLLSFRHHTAS